MARSRLGVALLVPHPVDREVDALRRACGDGALGRIPAHLTLVPPVNVHDRQLDDAMALLRRVGEATRPFTIGLGPPVTFLPDNPVLFLPVAEGADRVRAVRDAVFAEPLHRPLTWPFVPHVTIADEAEPERIRAALVALADYRASFVCERVHILRECRDAAGLRVWEPIADAGFRAPAVVGRGGLPLQLDVSERPDPEATGFLERAWAEHALAERGAADPPDVPVVVTARRDGRVVGVAAGQVRGAESYLADLIVAGDVRGEGVGAHLLAAFHAEVAARGATFVGLRTVAGGPAEQFYRRKGYVDHVALPAWRHGRDFVQLRRDL
jgi:2'-5' RNA ligase/GNAT superfamily N-acetyltransferase